jgi:hypothetical protein
MKTCKMDDCPKPKFARGWCATHYHRWRKYGNPTTTLWDPRFRFKERTASDGDCLVWTNPVMDGEYPRFRVDGRQVLAHRYSYEIHVGPIPDGMFIDHRCHNRKCVKPEHLRLATNKQNLENLLGAHSSSKSGVRGVYYRSSSNKWCAQVGHNNKSVFVGNFDSLEEAEAAVVAKRNELYTHNDADRRVQS